MEKLVSETMKSFGRGAVAEAIKGGDVGLFGWVKGGLTVGATDAVYGESGNPLREEGVPEAFW